MVALRWPASPGLLSVLCVTSVRLIDFTQCLIFSGMVALIQMLGTRPTDGSGTRTYYYSEIRITGLTEAQVPEIRYLKDSVSLNTLTVPQYCLLYALPQYGQRIRIPYILPVRHYGPVVP